MGIQSDLIFLKYLQDSIESLNKLDELIETNGQRQSEIDSELCDLLHLIECQELSNSACIKITKRIQELRKVRRGLRNEYELIIKYQEVKSRLSSRENRQFITAEIQKRLKSLNQEYKNRVLTDEQVNELLKEDINPISQNKKERRKRSDKSLIINQKIKEMIDRNCSRKEMATELGISQGAISQRIKKIKGLENA